MIIYDSSGNSASDIVLVTVTGDILPQVTTPDDLMIEYGAVGDSLNNNIVNNNRYSFYLTNSNSNTLTNNIVFNNAHGIILTSSSSNTLTNNFVTVRKVQKKYHKG